MRVRVPRYLVAAATCALMWPASAWGWAPPTDLSDDSQSGNQPAVGMNLRGDTASAWSDQIDAYHSVIYVRVRPGGGSWGAARTLSEERWFAPAGTFTID
jgi:hypothetical protein